MWEKPKTVIFENTTTNSLVLAVSLEVNSERAYEINILLYFKINYLKKNTLESGEAFQHDAY